MCRKTIHPAFRFTGKLKKQIKNKRKELSMRELMTSKGITRRGFISGLVPVCALTCLSMKKAMAWNFSKGDQAQKSSGHKFDKPYSRQLTFRQVSNIRYRNFISLAKDLEKEMGKEALIEFLKKRTLAQLLDQGKGYAKRSPDTSFRTFSNIFKNPRMQATLTMEIIEDTDTVFEVKVTECLVGDTFLRSKAGEIGNATVCIGDYTFAEGFNPKIKMIRDKTLTLGHAYCNHRYVWQD